MSKHTPGPWKADDKGKAVFIPLRAHHCEQLGIQVGFVSWEDDKEPLANARLIAAAPELLEALRVFVSCSLPVSTEIDERGHRWTEAYLDQALPIARAAIAKATGEQT
jgi:hypothetical protein